jgi:poly [ADP-ribose] polymerase
LIQSKPQNKEDEAPNKFEVFNIFSVNRLEEEQNFARQMSNQKLLVHGSRVANYVGLLSRGILLPKIVVSRGMSSRTDFGYLGSGVYFSDNLYASVKYAAPSKNGNRFALMTLVSLGRAKEFTKITPNLEKAPEGFDSCLGLAQTSQKSSDFLNNEYVVYDASQYKNQYLVEFKLL